MPYPRQFQAINFDMYEQTQFIIPWINYLNNSQDPSKQHALFSWAYWACLFVFRKKLAYLLIDFVVIFLIFVYFHKC